MPKAESGSPKPTTPEDDELARAEAFARRTHKAMGHAIEQMARAARKKKGSSDPPAEERPAEK